MVDEKETAPRRGFTEARASVVAVAAGVVRWVGLIFASILVVHVILVVGHANPANRIYQTFHDLADPLAMGFRDLFTPDDEKLRVFVNYGLAALFWLVVSSIGAKLIRRLG